MRCGSEKGQERPELSENLRELAGLESMACPDGLSRRARTMP